MALYEVETNLPTAPPVQTFPTYGAALQRAHSLLDEVEDRQGPSPVLKWGRKPRWVVKMYRVDDEGQNRRREQVGQWTRGRGHRAVGQPPRRRLSLQRRHGGY